MSTVVDLVGGPHDGESVTVPPPWPRTQVRFEDGSTYFVREGTTIADFYDPALDAQDPDPGGIALAGVTGPPGLQGPPGLEGPVGPQGPAGPARVHRGPWDAGGTYVEYDEVQFDGSSYTLRVGGVATVGTAPPDDPGDWLLTSLGSTGGGGSLLDVWQGDWDGLVAYAAGDVVHHLGSSWLALDDVAAPPDTGPTLITVRLITAVSQLADGVEQVVTVVPGDPLPQAESYPSKMVQFEVAGAGDVTVTTPSPPEAGGSVNTELKAADGTGITSGNLGTWTATLPAAGMYALFLQIAPTVAVDVPWHVTVASGTATIVDPPTTTPNDEPVEGAVWTYVAEGGTGGGADGASAYQVWLDAGNTGTVDDYLASLAGPAGPTGATGAAGAAGATGPTGPAGPSSYDTAPIGEIKAWSRTAIPEGYALANGQALLRADYPDAWAAAQAEITAGNPLWTAGDGSTTFTVPNLTDKFVYGKGANALGATGGAATVTLTAAQSGLPSHSHPVVDNAGFSLTVVDENNPAGGIGHYRRGAGGGPAILTAAAQTAADAASSHQNLPPYVVMAWIVKVKGVTVSSGALVGPAGPQGPTGPQGVQGPLGPQGAAGGSAWADVKVAITGNVSVSAPTSATYDGVTLVAGDRALLCGQTDTKQNGIYTLQNGPIFVRATDADESAEFFNGRKVYVSGGTLFGKSEWQYSGVTGPVLATDVLPFRQLGTALARVLIAEVILTANGVLSASGIPQTFKHLEVIAEMDSVRSLSSSTAGLRFTWNGYGSNYHITGRNTGNGTGNTFDVTNVNDVRAYLGQVSANNGAAVQPPYSTARLFFPEYTRTDMTARVCFVEMHSGITEGASYFEGSNLHYQSSGLEPGVTSLAIFDDGPGTVRSGSRMRLYGLV
jgi:microcystin-dependent protein